MGWSFGKKGNRKHSKIDALPPEMKATVEEMILDGTARSWSTWRRTDTA